MWGKDIANAMIRAVQSAVQSAVLLTADLRDDGQGTSAARPPSPAISTAHYRIVHHDLAVPPNRQPPYLVAFVAASAAA